MFYLLAWFLILRSTWLAVFNKTFYLTGLPVLGGMFLTFYVGTKVNDMRFLGYNFEMNCMLVGPLITFGGLIMIDLSNTLHFAANVPN